MAGAPDRTEATFGALARRIAPRLVGVFETEHGPRVRLGLRARALEPAERRALAGLATAHLARGPGADGHLTCDPAQLDEAAEGSPLFRALAAAAHHGSRRCDPPRVMGIVNVTPDSFSDGGLYLDPERAVEHGVRLAAQGAEVVDVGGESTRPGAAAVGAREELERVLPVVGELARRLEVPVSVDTTKASVAAAALGAGASWINDVSAGRADPEMLALVADRGCTYVAMHMQGEPATMQAAPEYADPTAEIVEFLRARVAACLKAGIEPHKIVVDPGIGFGKRLEHNLDLLRRLFELRSLGRPILVGVSRKSFIGHVTGAERPADWLARGRRDRPPERLGGSAAAVAAAVLGGADWLRVHDVEPMLEAARVARAVRDSSQPVIQPT